LRRLSLCTRWIRVHAQLPLQNAPCALLNNITNYSQAAKHLNRTP
jgi:hypothetical protein